MHILLHAHQDQFKNIMGAYLEEQGERFHQDAIHFGRRYQDQCNESVMDHNVWGLMIFRTIKIHQNTVFCDLWKSNAYNYNE